MKRILFLSAHADDAFVAVGGIMHYYIQHKDHDVHHVVFSIAEDSVPAGFDKDIVETECKMASEYLGLDPANLIIDHFQVRRFPEFRQQILDTLITIREKLNPDIVFTPSTQDIHQDHRVLCEETMRAFSKSCSIYGYDFPWNVIFESKLNLFYELDDALLDKKIEAMKFFRSQISKKNNCLTDEYIRSLAIERGNRVQLKYAEAVEIIRDIRRLP